MVRPANLENRKLKLGSIKFYQKTYKGAYLAVSAGKYIGDISAQGAELISDTAEQQGVSRKPAALELFDSTTHPGDVVGLPTMTRTEDELPLDWDGKGQTASTDTGRFLTLKQVEIPARNRVFFDLYPDTDPDLGPVVGIKVKGARFEQLTARKKKEGGGQDKPA